MKTFFILLLAGSCSLAWAQTNAPVENSPEPQTDITSDTGHFDGINYRMIYLGHVVMTDAKATLQCEKLTVDLQKDGGHPTNIVAVTNVVIDVLDSKGQTNHITADQAVYTYSVVNAVTNEVITFTGGNPKPKVDNPQLTMEGDSLTFDLVTKQFNGVGYRTTFKPKPNSGNGTNASPFNFFK